MRSPSRLVPGLLGLALAAPVAGVSAQEYYQPRAGSPPPFMLEQGRAPRSGFGPAGRSRGSQA